MREILFRGKRNDNGEWFEGGLVHRTRYYGDPCDDYVIVENAEFDYDYYEAHTVIAETVGQFTGLTDKNGKKIFEGDIFKGKVIEGKLVNYVFWYDEEERGFVYGSSYKKGYRMSLASYALSVKEFEVIGNIHDNPELLK